MKKGVTIAKKSIIMFIQCKLPPIVCFWMRKKSIKQDRKSGIFGFLTLLTNYN